MEKSLIPRSWEVPDEFRRRLGNKVGRQRLMAAGGHLLLVLHLPPEPDQHERQGRLLWRKPDGSWSSNDLGSGSQVVGKHLDQFAEHIGRWDEREERAESIADYFAVLEALAPLLRATRHLHQVLQDARTAMPDDRDLINFRDRAYEIERSAELLAEETRHSLELALAKRAEEQTLASRKMAVSAHRLNLLAAFFFPLATVSAIFGMNLLHGYEQSVPPVPLLATVAAGLAAGLLLMAFVTVSRR